MRRFPLAALAGLLLGVGPAPAARLCTASWAPAPAPAVHDGRLYALSFAAASDGWAVGEVGTWAGADDPPGPATPLLEHWDGAQWTQVALGGGGSLDGVVAVSTTDAWAVGETPGPEASDYPVAYDRPTGSTLLAHSDGHGWTRTGFHATGALRAVAAAGPRDVWAVGVQRRHGLIAHWNGIHWRVTAWPAAPLADVTVVSPADVWAVGDDTALHWDGRRWRSFPLPRRVGESVGPPFLVSVAATSSRDVWAAGAADVPVDRSTFAAQPALLHWDGMRWHDASPKVERVGLDSNLLGMVAAGGKLVIAAVGEDGWLLGPLLGGAVATVAGSTWSVADLPHGSRFERLAVAPGGAVWAAGYAASGSPSDEYGLFDHTDPLLERRGC